MHSACKVDPWFLCEIEAIIAAEVGHVELAYDYVCETMVSPLAEPMRKECANLTEAVVESGHWMAQEKPVEVNAALAMWLAKQFPQLWLVKGR